MGPRGARHGAPWAGAEDRAPSATQPPPPDPALSSATLPRASELRGKETLFPPKAPSRRNEPLAGAARHLPLQIRGGVTCRQDRLPHGTGHLSLPHVPRRGAGPHQREAPPAPRARAASEAVTPDLGPPLLRSGPAAQGGPEGSGSWQWLRWPAMAMGDGGEGPGEASAPINLPSRAPRTPETSLTQRIAAVCPQRRALRQVLRAQGERSRARSPPSGSLTR